jgi:hypothetical protein
VGHARRIDGGGVTAPAAAVQAKPGLLRRYLPILGWLASYRREWLPADAVAALSVWALLVPQGLQRSRLGWTPDRQG